MNIMSPLARTRILDEFGVDSSEVVICKNNLLVTVEGKDDLTFWKKRLKRMGISYVVAEYRATLEHDNLEEDSRARFTQVGIFADRFYEVTGMRERQGIKPLDSSEAEWDLLDQVG